MAVVIPDGDWGSNFTAYILTYFGWPREVRLIVVNRENARSQCKRSINHRWPRSSFVESTPPASKQPGFRLGTDLVVVPTAAKE